MTNQIASGTGQMEQTAMKSAHTLSSEFSPLRLDIDPFTGLPQGLINESNGREIALNSRVSLVLGGEELRGPLGGLVYDGAKHEAEIVVTGTVSDHLVEAGRCFVVPVRLGDWRGEIRYLFQLDEPRLTWNWRWRPTKDAPPIRDFQIELEAALAGSADWTVNVPGARIRPSLALCDLPEEMEVQSIGGLASSSGVIGLSRQSDLTFVIWPRSHDERGHSTLGATDQGVRLIHSTRLCAAAMPCTDLIQDGIALDLVSDPWPVLRTRIQSWLARFGLTIPDDKPAWSMGATIYEAQIGTSIFAGGQWTYSPYPEMSDLYADLPRIADLGFDTIQLMPHQPFPSYNVIDYGDVNVSYGDEEDLHRVVKWCHAHGMRLILDVLMHGVIDQESFSEVVAAVRAGPWAEFVTADADQVTAMKLTAAQQRELSWSRHIIDFERAWHDNSPTRHPLADEHPDWFCRDSNGCIIGIYTKAFDLSNPDWQRYFSDAMLGLVNRLGIDGFRFDAPCYNAFPNWSPRTRSRASLQELGALSLFRSLRREMHERNPDLMLYTEPNGAIWRQSMDITYNYDETWLLDSILGRGGDHPPSRVRNGHDLALWLAERDLSLPQGAVTAHHIDSHDTFWWPLPGLKWRRDQFGADSARALMTAFALSGGPYMMFVGGENSIEADVRKVNEIRSQRTELAFGRHEFGALLNVPEQIFEVTHELNDARSIVIVNLSADAVSFTFIPDSSDPRWKDLLDDADTEAIPGELISFTPFSARFMVPYY
jgi:hypothetical protein